MNNGESASTSTDPPVRTGFFTVAKVNGSKSSAPIEGSASKSKDSSPLSSKVFIPTKVVELSSIRLISPNVTANSNQNSDPLPLKISSVASGEEVTLMTNGFDDIENEVDYHSEDSDDDDNNDDDNDNNHLNDEDEINTQPQISEVTSLATSQDNAPEAMDSLSQIDSEQMDASNFPAAILVQTKTESIDISDDEHRADVPDNIKSVAKESLVIGSEACLKGYIYCSTNIQLGKVTIEWTGRGRIKLQLAESTDVECDESEPFQKNLVNVSAVMNKYVRERFYGVYPAHLRLEWIFIKTDDVETCGTSLCDFNTVEPFSVRKTTILFN